MANQGRLIIVAGPSGSGKSTLIGRFMKEHPEYHFPTSATTRSPRTGETHGKEYYFLSHEEFKKRLDNQEFLEHAQVFGEFYGTLKSVVSQALDRGEKLLKDVDVQGARSLMEILKPPRLVSIFISPPSFELLAKRLRERASEDETTVNRRLNEAQKEMAQSSFFDHELVNDDLQLAYQAFSKLLLELGESA